MHARPHPNAVTFALLAASLLAAPASAQNNAADAPQQINANFVESPQQKLERAWLMLQSNIKDAKHLENRTQALSALADLGDNPRSTPLIAGAMSDPELEVRSAAAVAAGKTRSRSLVAPLEKLLDDKEPQVVYIAATVLWRDFNDKAGEDILDTIVSGERKASPTLVHGAKHQMSRTLHSPSAMATLGVTNGAGLLLGPFGFSIAAIQYMRKNGSDTSRVDSLILLADDKSTGVEDDLMSALSDKDSLMRATAAKLLGDRHQARYAPVIAPLLDDDKLPVRLTASAAYIKSLGGGSTRTTHAKHHK